MMSLSTPDFVGVVIVTITYIICSCIFGIKMQRDVDKDEEDRNNS